MKIFTVTNLLRTLLPAAVAVAVAIGAGCGSNRDNPPNLTGRWIFVGEGGGGDMELFKDGTGVIEDETIKWKVENKRFVIMSPSKGKAFDYKVSGYELILVPGVGDSVRFVKKERLEEYEKKQAEETRKDIEQRRQEVERLRKKAEQGFEKISGYFTDSRNGQKYRTVKIGGKTWMAQNLNYQTGKSWCYDDDNWYCDTYGGGRLYDWNTAITVCPEGWHLPSRQEWKDLVTVADGGKALRTVYGWGDYHIGTDAYGFSAIPSGDHGDHYINGYGDFGFGYWWTATEFGSVKAYSRMMGSDGDGNYVSELNTDKGNGYSVRCVEGDISQNGGIGYGGIGYGSGYGSGFGGGGGGIDDLLSGLMGGGGGGLELKKAGELKVTSPDFLKGGALDGARSRASIQRVVMQNMAALRYAYNKRLRDKPGISGEIKVKFSIDEFGKVISAQIVGSTMDDSELETTVVRRVNSWNFEKIDKPGDVTTVTYPFVFSQ